MRISVNIANYSWPGGAAALCLQLRRLVQTAGEAGLDTVWVPDHLIQADPDAGPGTDMLEWHASRAAVAEHCTARGR